MINYESYDSLVRKSKLGINSATEELLRRNKVVSINGLNGINNEYFVYVPSKEIDNQISLLSDLYKKAENTQGYKDIILLDSYHSATIEGAKTTVENVKEAIKKNKFTESDKMVYNTMKALNYAYDNKITLDNIRFLWEIVVDSVCENESKKGIKFRDGMVYISNGMETMHTPQKPEKIEKDMMELFDFLEVFQGNFLINSIIYHFYFVYIHPFCDGNGRTARILMSSYLVHCGLEKFKSIPVSKYINQERSGYYNTLLESEKTRNHNDKIIIDITSFIVYMLNIFEKALLSSIITKNYDLSDNEIKVLNIMRKKGKGSELTVKKCSKILHISEKDALYMLNCLTEKGYLDKKRREKNYYNLVV